mmetsp:Transcript_52505/g.114613  ORF Transcript_52505/g.114613 Transcript_52505/m.114613 type:complete len:231 (-) Transcript_52505:72-764(-)
MGILRKRTCCKVSSTSNFFMSRVRTCWMVLCSAHDRSKSTFRTWHRGHAHKSCSSTNISCSNRSVMAGLLGSAKVRQQRSSPSNAAKALLIRANFPKSSWVKRCQVTHIQQLFGSSSAFRGAETATPQLAASGDIFGKANCGCPGRRLFATVSSGTLSTSRNCWCSRHNAFSSGALPRTPFTSTRRWPKRTSSPGCWQFQDSMRPSFKPMITRGSLGSSPSATSMPSLSP